MALPVLPVRASRASRWRAAVLIGVHLLIAVHIAHWWLTGSTISPLEPSEAMDFSKRSIINAGLILFAVAILSTLVLGRFFCGWGCHIIALQDLSRYILGKFGIKPRPLRSRLLLLVPLAAFIYMFIYPVAVRLWLGLPFEQPHLEVTKADFWGTFPGWAVALLTFVVCGFLIVYLLGSKGFCTYACPYGGIFGLVDRLAPGRIRVTDACEGCGHCTAVCSSNVRVHEEVRDFGMVIDPGCMKCMDCVSVCPNDALYFGFGRPALGAAPRATPKPRRAAFTWPEELLLAVFFVAALFSFRGLYNAVPFLLALGWAAILSYLAVQTVRLFRRQHKDLSICGWCLKKGQRLQRPGRVFAGVMVVLGAFWVHSALVRYHGWQADRWERRSHAIEWPWYDNGASIAALSPADRQAIENLGRHAGWVQRWGLLADPAMIFHQARSSALLGQFDHFERHMARVLARSTAPPELRTDLGRYFEWRQKPEQAVEHYRAAIDQAPNSAIAYQALGRLEAERGRLAEAAVLLDQALSRAPRQAALHHDRGWVAYLQEDLERACRGFEQALGFDPHHPESRQKIAALCPAESEVLANIRGQRAGDYTIADHRLPEEFLRRVADLVIRETYQDQYHYVLPPEGGDHSPRDASAAAAADAEAAAAGTSAVPEALRTVRPALPEQVVAYRQGIQPGYPALRGFKPAILERAGAMSPTTPAAGTPRLRRAAELVATGLAVDGLPATLVRVLNALGPGDFTDAFAGDLQTLESIGLPVDWLAFFPPTGAEPGDPAAIVEHLARRLHDGEAAESLAVAAAGLEMRFVPTWPGYEAASEAGDHAPRLVRLQISGGLEPATAGPSTDDMDLVQQLTSALPDADFLVSIPEKGAAAFAAEARGWPLAREGQLTIASEPLPLSQWAQDNGKAGTAPASGGGRETGTLVPRFGTQGNIGALLVPGETFLADGLAAAGHAVRQSPLLFQGGNLITVDDPAGKQRVLLVSEAEIYRNTPLGLTRGQVIEAFRREFGVDRVVMLPLVSFHIDLDVCVRAHEGHVIAFVNDPQPATLQILELGLQALQRHGRIDENAAGQVFAALGAGRLRDVLVLISQVIGPYRQAIVQGGATYTAFPASLAEVFAAGPGDDGPANLQRFLIAVDALVSAVLQPQEYPTERHAAAYIRSFARQNVQRAALIQTLVDLGWTVVRVPGLSETRRSLNYVNGLHIPGRYLMPVYGGFFKPLDDAAAAVFTAALGPGVEIVPIDAAAVQRRAGGLHCAAALYP